MSFTDSDKKEIEKIVRREIQDFMKTTQVNKIVVKMIQDELGTKKIDDKIVDLSTKVVVELFKTLWQRKSFWESALKMSNKEKNIRPDIDGEMDEIQRLSQDLKREDDIDISVDKIVKAFKESNEETLSDDIWVNLENTESNEIKKGDWDSVIDIAKKYKKTNPKKLKTSIENGDYERPLIVKLGDRHILVAGNTRLCTSAAMGVNPKVFIAKINVNTELNEKWSQKYKKSINCNNPKGFSQRAHCQGKKKKMNEDNKLKGGLSDKMSLGDISVKHKVDIEDLTKEYIKGVKIEMEHTKDKQLAKEIAMDHLVEDPKYYTKLSKIETKEDYNKSAKKQFSVDLQTDPDFIEFKKNAKYKDGYKEFTFGTPNVTVDDPYIKKRKYSRPGKGEQKEATDAGSSGQYSANAFGNFMSKREIYKLHNTKLNEEEEVTEVTSASSSGGYDVPFAGKTPKGRKNPLSIEGPESIKRSRAVKDKKFPKYGGPGGIFIKIKEKCKKFPYCNQGDINAIEVLRESISEVSKETGVPLKELNKLVLNKINEIFINYES